MKAGSTNYLIGVVVLSVLVALVGAFVQYNGESSIALSRAGAIIVCIGILYGFIELKLIFSKLEANRLQNDIVFSDSELRKGVRGSTDQLKDKIERDRWSPDNRAAVADLIILVVGTLLWGFGDLLV